MKQLTDQFNRTIEYLRLSVTDRCDLRCFYCLPDGFNDFQEPDEWLSFDEIERVITAFGKLGVSKVRITGGEPLIRKGLPELAARLSAIPEIDDLSLSSNATRLDKEATKLHKSGISRLNISLDSINADNFRQITGGKLDKVLNGIMTAKDTGFDLIKINMVVMNGINDHEIYDMVDFCIENNFTLRFIETMPMGETGQSATDHFISLQTIKQRLAERFELLPGVMPGGGPARYVQVAGTDLRIGFITPISQHFCETCNRVRLSADGTLHMCLGQEHSFDLRPLLRAGISDENLQKAIAEAVQMKPEKHEFNDSPGKVVRFMSMTGG